MTQRMRIDRDETQPLNLAPGNGRRLLVVGVTPNTTEVLEMVFRSRGWDVATALSLSETFDRLDPPPDCLLTELVLYFADGSLCEVVRAVRVRSPAVRVVLMDDPRERYGEEVFRRVREQGLGLPADGSASDAQYDAFFEACDQAKKRLLDEEIRPDAVVSSPNTLEEYVRACET